MAALIFENYIVDNLIFKNNPNFNQIDEEVQIEPNIEVEISKDKDSAIVNLEITLNKNQNNPIYIVEVSIIGIFKYNSNESEGFNFDDLLTTNAIAILFPYARSLVSDLTAKSNMYPNFNLPIINVVQMLKENNQIKFNWLLI